MADTAAACAKACSSGLDHLCCPAVCLCLCCARCRAKHRIYTVHCVRCQLESLISWQQQRQGSVTAVHCGTFRDEKVPPGCFIFNQAIFIGPCMSERLVYCRVSTSWCQPGATVLLPARLALTVHQSAQQREAWRRCYSVQPDLYPTHTRDAQGQKHNSLVNLLACSSKICVCPEGARSTCTVASWQCNT